MKKIGFIQPGRLGDIIILLPAAKYFHDQGHKIFWPIFKNYISQFKDYISYVNFLPIESNIYTGVSDSYNALKEINVTETYDVAATFPGSVCTEDYVKAGDGLKIPFDKYKYDRLKVPLEEKWKLQIKRNFKKEEELFNLYVKESEYCVCCLEHSGGRLNKQLDSNGIQMIEINTKHNIFDWIKILENAKVIALVESSISNLVEQLNMPNKKILFKKDDSRLPVLRNNWKIV
jgi:hypothetical protein